MFGLNSYFHNPGSSEITVYVIIAEECPICNYMGKPLSKIADEYKERVKFIAVFPLKNSNYKTIHLFKLKYGLEAYESLLDSDQQITKKLGASVTPEVIITRGDTEILYRGRINDSYYAPGKVKHRSRSNDLKSALDNIFSGIDVNKPWAPAVGCYITLI